MRTMEISDKELVVNKQLVHQLLDQITQIKTGLLHVLNAVESARINCTEVKTGKANLLKGNI